MINGKHLKKLRDERGYTIEDIANAVHVSPSTVSRWENKDSLTDYASIKLIADFYGISIDELTHEAYSPAETECAVTEAETEFHSAHPAKKQLSLLKIGLITAAGTFLFFAIIASIITVCIYFTPIDSNGGEVRVLIYTKTEIAVLICLIFLIIVAVTFTVVLICYFIRKSRSKRK